MDYLLFVDVIDTLASLSDYFWDVFLLHAFLFAEELEELATCAEFDK